MAQRDFTKIIMPNKEKWYKDGMEHVSNSKVECYSMCSLKWALKYILKEKEPWSDNLAFGQVHHTICEKILTDAYNDKNFYKTVNQEYIDKVLIPEWHKSFAEEFKDHNLESKDYEDMKKMSFASVPITLKWLVEQEFELLSVKGNDGTMIQAQEFGVGVPVENPSTKKYLDNYYLQVWPDAVVRDKKGDIIILDHKTAARRYTDDKLKTAMQLPLYAYALKDILKDNGYDYKFKVAYAVLLKQKNIAVEYYEKDIDGEDINTALYKICMAVDGMEKKAISASPIEMVHNFCGFRGKCLRLDDECVNYRKVMEITTGEYEPPKKEIKKAEEGVGNEAVQGNSKEDNSVTVNNKNEEWW